jgi:ADP-heptose:LPS heptosyltransferase
MKLLFLKNIFIFIQLNIINFFLDIILRKLFLKNNLSGIIIVRVDAIGDFIIWLDSAKHYREIYPGKKITLLVNSVYAEYCKNFNYWDSVIPIDLNSFKFNIFYRFKIIKEIRNKFYLTAIHPNYSRAFHDGDVLIKQIRAINKIGFDGDFSNISKFQKRISNCWYTKLIQSNNINSMELLRNGEFIQKLSGHNISISTANLPNLSGKINNSYSTNYCIFIPGASWSGKCWGILNFSNLINKIITYHNYKILLCGSENEVELCNALELKCNSAVLNLSGKTSLEQFIELIRGADFVVGNDSSAIHIAAAVGTPSVAILGGGHPDRFLPYPETINCIQPLVAYHKLNCYGCNWRCNQISEGESIVPCVSNIKIEDVYALIKRAISN